MPDPLELLAAVADPVRWQLLATLSDGGVHTAGQLLPIAAVPPNLLSYHLKVLRETGLVRSRRRGRSVQYVIAPDALQRLHEALPSAGVTRQDGTMPGWARPCGATQPCWAGRPNHTRLLRRVPVPLPGAQRPESETGEDPETQ